MNLTNRKAKRLLSADALKLVVIIDVCMWLGLLVASKGVKDFSVLYTSGGVILEGHHAQLFDMQTQTEFQHRVLGMHALLPFNHLAYESLLFIPLALLPYRLALWTWRILSGAMLLLSIRFLAKTFQRPKTQVFVLSISLFPVTVAFLQGQDTILTLLLLSACLAALTRGREQLAGFLIALALFKPHLVLPIAAVLLWKRGYGFLRGFLGGSAAILLISIGITGVNGWRQMSELMHYAASGTGNSLGGVVTIRPNLRGILGLSGLEAHTAVILTMVVSALLFLLIAWHLRNQHSPEILFPPLIAFTLLGGLYVNAHDFALLLIPVLAMLGQDKKSALLCVSACFCMPLFWISRQIPWFFLVLCAVLFLTVQQPTANEAEAIAVG